ncbi:hypothetical protein OIO89_01320 (plasmid) [Mycobacterium ulcerans]|nr:hypothetical protein OIO89_01320 [Mycobacterium ulcerans]
MTPSKPALLPRNATTTRPINRFGWDPSNPTSATSRRARRCGQDDQAITHATLPATLHVDQPSPLDWSSGTVQLLTEPINGPTPTTPAPRRCPHSASAAPTPTSSSATPTPNPTQTPEDCNPAQSPCATITDAGTGLSFVPWVISAKSAEALSAQASRLLTRLDDDPVVDAIDLGWSLIATRSMFEHRAVVVGADRHQLQRGLAELASGSWRRCRWWAGPRSGRDCNGVSGQGSQRLGMGAAL